MYYLLAVLSVLFMLSLPLALATWLGRRYRANWGLFGAGVISFVGSQLLHIPFNVWVDRAGWLPSPAAGWAALLAVAAFYGLSAGFFEEVARYLVYRWWARDARSWSEALMLGAGHGGIEAILLGLLLAIQVAFLAGVRSGHFLALLPGEHLALAQGQAEQMANAPILLGVLPAVERIFALTLHLSLSLLVLQAFVRAQQRWLWLAVGWHALADAVAVAVVTTWGIYAAEAAVAVMALVSLGMILRLRRRPLSALPVEASLPPPAPVSRPEKAPALDTDKLEESRYL